ncbi:MAG: glycerate 2-kinase [Verrucomicrobiota bacterium]
MRILIAPDKFKGSLGAREVADGIAAGLRDILPAATIEILPVADGGEGTADVISQARAGEWVDCDAHDALGRAITARYFWLREKPIAVMEMNEAAGMWRIAPDERDPMHGNTFGVGEMMKNAASRGVKEILIGLGGSATNDGGFGMARALGFRFYANGLELERLEQLANLTAIKRPTGPLLQVKIIAAVDVRNPLLGERGATRTFGPQKGGTPEQLEILERGLARLADVVGRDLHCDFRGAPGAGAAGGLGFGLMSFCGAEVRPGFDIVAEFIDVEAAIQRADVVVTGEGSLDRQTLEGKAPAGVARLARKNGKRVYAIAGAATEDRAVLEVFDGVFSLATPPITREEAMSRTTQLLRDRARELAAIL